VYEISLVPSFDETQKSSDILKLLGLGKQNKDFMSLSSVSNSSESSLYIQNTAKDERCMVYVKGSHKVDAKETDPNAARQVKHFTTVN
jgi:hypothetical protein